MMDKQYNLQQIVESCDKLSYIDYKHLLDNVINDISITVGYKQKDLDTLYTIKELIINIMEYLDK